MEAKVNKHIFKVEKPEKESDNFSIKSLSTKGLENNKCLNRKTKRIAGIQIFL
jgi:hypothetical protein